MRKTLREDRERMVLQSELLNDNSLLEYSTNHGYMDVGVRYVDSAAIREDILLHMNIVEFMKHKEELVQKSEDGNAIAIYKPGTKPTEYVLDTVYDAQSHEFAIPEFVDLVYQKRFPNQPLKNSYVKVRQ